MPMDFFSKKKDDIDDDPTDFSQPSLQALDASVRCPICKEFYTHPVITPCNHSFCSACVRVSLELESTEKRTCPICATKITSEKDLRANGALEDIVDRYKATRPVLVELAHPRSPAEPSPRKRRKPTPSSALTTGPTSSTNNPSASLTAGVTGTPSRHVHGAIIELSDDDDDEESGMLRPTEGKGKESAAGPQEGAATCPICENVVPEYTINKHIDSGCHEYLEFPIKKKTEVRSGFFGSGATSSARKTDVGTGASNGTAKTKASNGSTQDLPAAHRLSRPNYNLLSEKQLRLKLEEFSLSTNGKKAELEARHRQWILLFNSNLDSRHPARESELRVELKKWDADRERDLKAKRKRAEKEPLDDDTYQKVHASDFASLTKQVRDRALAQKKALGDRGEASAINGAGSDVS